jgi:uncharacterized protein YyaL (SSP411 family)
VNRLASATSPYLLQHKDNPVEWWEWSPEAFAEAKRLDRPVLLSVGYAACHWCHVMAHDSFEDDEVAAVLNADYVSIKVDREERPDVDAVYMDAVTAMTGQGGWPMTCLLTADGRPFYAGTFFPRQQFMQLLAAVTDTWRSRREEILDAGQRVLDALSSESSLPKVAGLGDVELAAAVTTLGRQFDVGGAGFGQAPKFPPSMVIEFLLRHHERTGEATSLTMATDTLRAMARGGMYDQLGGGFARYSVDAAWVVPHFEKMLYDNALLLRAYVHWWRLSGDRLAARIARETADFLLRDLRTPEGGFASALDADTDGVEGLTYVWTPAQLSAELGSDAPWAAQLFEVTASGTFEHGSSTLQLPADPEDPARWADVRSRLFAARSRRPQPGRDDKVVTSWNGLAVGALAEAGVVLGEPSYLAAATACARLLVERHIVDGRLRRTSRDGDVGLAAGVADDYGNLADGLLLLHQASADPGWLEVAGSLLDVALSHFSAEDGGVYDAADDAEQLIRRPRDPADNASPSGLSSIINALVAYSALTGSLAHRSAAERMLSSAAALASQPRFFGWSLSAAEALLSGPVEVAIVGEDGAGHGSGRDGGGPDCAGPLTAAAWASRPPGAVIVSGAPDAAGLPLLADRRLVDGQAAACVCRAMVCERPVTTVIDLVAALTSRRVGS